MVGNSFNRFEGKIVVLSSKKCPACASLKSKIEASDVKDNFIFLNVEESEEAKLISEAFNIRSVPSMVKVEKREDKLTMCLLDSKYEAKKCFEVEGQDERGVGGEG